MNRHFLILLVLIAAALVSLAVSRTEQPSKQFSQGVPQGTLVLPNLSHGDTLNEIAKIELIYPSATVTVQRIDGVWCAPDQAGYPVRVDAVAGFLRTLADLKIGQVITINPDQLMELGLSNSVNEDPVSAYTHILLYDSTGKRAADLILGKPRTGDAAQGTYGPEGRYAKAGDVVSVVSEPFYSVPRNTLNWMDTTLIEAAPDTLVSLSAAEVDQEPLTFNRDASNQWTSAVFTDELPLDQEKVTRLADLFNRLGFAGVLARDDSKLKEYGLEKPVTYTAQTRDGTRITLFVGHAQPTSGNRYALAEMEAFSTEPEPTEKAMNHLSNAITKNEEMKKWVYLIPAERLNGVFAHHDDYVKVPAP